MLDALVAGTTDPGVLADLARGRLRTKLPALRQALTGRFRAHHAFLVSQLLAHLDYLDEALAHVDLETLWGRSGRQLRERLLAATTPMDTFRIVEATLLERLSGPLRPRDAVRFALDALSRSGSVTVRDVTARVGLSHRRFVEVFKTEVGLTPKRFHCVRRLQHMLAFARRATAPEWSRLAVDGGFFDQSHLIHEFVRCSGFTPAKLARHLHELRERGVHLKRNHLPLAS